MLILINFFENIQNQDLDDDIFTENKQLFANLVNLFDSLASFITTFKQ